MSQYFLAKDVYFCDRRDSLVFLDLSKDDYVLVNGAPAAALRGLSTVSSMDTSALRHMLADLVEGGLLTTDGNTGRPIVPTRIDLAMTSLIDREGPPAAAVTSAHFLRFVAACTTAAAQLRWNSLSRIVHRVQRRKKRVMRATTFDLERATELAAAFIKLRSIFPKNYLCLFDSLALLEFLAGHELFPAWVFGIRLEPWAAHCWVQEQGLVFNESVEKAANYSPIMIV